MCEAEKLQIITVEVKDPKTIKIVADSFSVNHVINY